MASLIPSNEISVFSESLKNHFDTIKRSITVDKEPVKVVGNVQNKPYAGYGEDSEESNVTYVPQKQDFFAIVTYDNEQTEISSAVGTYEVGTGRIKVEKDASDYIKTGKTEYVEIDGKAFNKVTDDKVQSYLGTTFYIFYLQATS